MFIIIKNNQYFIFIHNLKIVIFFNHNNILIHYFMLNYKSITNIFKYCDFYENILIRDILNKSYCIDELNKKNKYTNNYLMY